MHLFSSHGPAQNLPMSSAGALDLALRVKANDRQGLIGPTTCFMPLDSSLASPSSTPLLYLHWPPCWFCLRIFALALPTAQNTLSLDNCPACSSHSLRTLCKYHLLSVVSPEQPHYPHFFILLFKKKFWPCCILFYYYYYYFWLFCVAGGILVPLPGLEPMPPVAEVES